MLLKYPFMICSLLVTLIFLYDYTMDHLAVIPCNILHQFYQCLESPKIKLVKKTASKMYLSCMPHHILIWKTEMGAHIKLQEEQFETKNEQHKFWNKLTRPNILLHRFLDKPIHLDYGSSILQCFDIGILYTGQSPQMIQNLGVTRKLTWSKFHTEDPQFCSDLWASHLFCAFSWMQVNWYTFLCVRQRTPIIMQKY
jgi:hypothetical protein